MTQLSKIFNLPTRQVLQEVSSTLLVSDDRVGVEVELENVPLNSRLRSATDTRWEIKEDGSLRNYGVEFVFAEPMFGEDVVNTIRNLPHVFQQLGIRPNISERCSVHVHLDVRDLEYNQLLNLVVTYLLCEPYFFAVGGE